MILRDKVTKQIILEEKNVVYKLHEFYDLIRDKNQQ